ncbi:MAG: response regulator [Candidatus Odinarchaeota archaeon]
MVNLLIADDSKYIRDLLRTILEKEGHTIVAEATSGTEVLQLYSEHQPELVLLDILMDEPNGIECVKQIKQNDPGAKILMISALGQDGIVNKAIAAGAIDYLVKPFKRVQIVEAINKVLEQ